MCIPTAEFTDAGEIVEAEPPRRLVIRWRHQDKAELKAEGNSLCTMELENFGTAVKLSITHTVEAQILETDRRGFRRLAESHLQPQIPSGNRNRCSEGTLPSQHLMRGNGMMIIDTIHGTDYLDQERHGQTHPLAGR